MTTEEERSLVSLDAEEEDYDDPNLTVLDDYEPQHGVGWYRCNFDGHAKWPKGTTVWMMSRDYHGEGRVQYSRGSNYYYEPAEDFDAFFGPDPQGALHRTEEIGRLMQDLDDMDKRSRKLTRALASGEESTYVSDETEATQALRLAGGRAESIKRQVATVRNTAQKMKLRMDQTRGTLQALLDEQSRILRGRMEELETMVTAAKKAIWTINLYLGTEEEIEMIRDGEPAPVDEPISIRQRVLYMDEECAIEAREGGIDYSTIGLFDEWLLSDPAHLNQVLPDLKGVVALRPRHKEKQRDRNGDMDPWLKAQKSQADKKTYLLVRNGQRLYRMWTEYEAGVSAQDGRPRLIPREDEFLAYFKGIRGQDIKAGSKEWMDAQKQSDSAQLHYRLFFLLLQGLLDRTTVLQPLPGPVNLGQPNTWGTIFKIIREDEKALVDDHERFPVWLKRINSKLDIGMRVVGAWSAWSHGFPQFYDGGRYGSGRNERLSARGTEYPDEDEIYTIESRKDGSYAFKYKRKGERWDRYVYGEPYKVRATAVIKPEDKFFICIDSPDVRIKDMEYFLKSRLDREEYEWMFPILETAIGIKKAEAEAEAPFRQLLISQMSSGRTAQVANGARFSVTMSPFDSLQDAEAAVDDVIRWYKTANRHHRALLADDAKALRLIVAEYQQRRRMDNEDALGTTELMLRERYPAAVLIAWRPSNDYVVLIPENNEPVFVREIVLDRLGVQSDKRWRTVSGRWQSWRVLYRAQRWDNWSVNTSPFDHLTDPERLEVAKAAWERVSERHGDWTLLAMTAEAGGKKSDKVTLWTRHGRFKEPASILDRAQQPTIHYHEVGWKRNAHRKVELMSVSDWSASSTNYLERSHKPFGKDDEWNIVGWPWSNARPRSATYKLLYVNDDGLRLAEADMEAYKAAQQRSAEFDTKSRSLQAPLYRLWRARVEADAFAKFLADYGDIELWEGHKKSLKLDDTLPNARGLDKLVTGLLLAGVDPDGMTWQQAHERFQSIVGQDVASVINEHGLFGQYTGHAYSDHRDTSKVDTSPPAGAESFILGAKSDPEPEGQVEEDGEE